MRIMIVSLLLLTVGCATTGERSTRDRNLLTLEEIQGSTQADAHGIIQSLRPQWLRVRGPVNFSDDSPIMVYMDGTRMGGPEVLRSIPTDTIEEIRYYSASQAQTRFGLDNVQGAIAIQTRRG